MTDIIDLAQEQEAWNLETALKAHAERAGAEPRLQPNGACHNPDCGDEFEPGSRQLYCGPPCAERHATIQAQMDYRGQH